MVCSFETLFGRALPFDAPKIQKRLVEVSARIQVVEWSYDPRKTWNPKTEGWERLLLKGFLVLVVTLGSRSLSSFHFSPRTARVFSPASSAPRF